MVISQQGLYKTATDILGYKKAITWSGSQSRMKRKQMEGNIFSSKKSCISAGPTAGSVKKRKDEMEKDTSLLHLVSKEKRCSFDSMRLALLTTTTSWCDPA